MSQSAGPRANQGRFGDSGECREGQCTVACGGVIDFGYRMRGRLHAEAVHKMRSFVCVEA